jgi:hypothetical protein
MLGLLNVVVLNVIIKSLHFSLRKIFLNQAKVVCLVDYNFIILFLNNQIENNVIISPMPNNINIFGRIASNGSTLQKMS